MSEAAAVGNAATPVAYVQIEERIPFYGTVLVGIGAGFFLITSIICACMLCRALRKKKKERAMEKTKHSPMQDFAAMPTDLQKVQPDIEDLTHRKYGRLQYLLSYDFETETLSVHVLQCAKLPSVDLASLSDPYVKVCIRPDSKPVHATKSKMDDLNPVFNEQFVFKVGREQLCNKSVAFVVYDYNRITQDEKMCQCSVPLTYDNVKLLKPEWIDLEAADSGGQVLNVGDLCLALRYAPTTGELKVVIIEAKNVSKKDPTSEVYVKLSLLVKNKRLSKKKTSLLKDTVNPYFNEAFTFHIPVGQIQDASLVVSICEYSGRLGKYSDIGDVVFSANSASKEAMHWIKILSDSGHTIAQWHCAQTRRST